MKFLTFEKTEKAICEIKDNKKFKKSKIIYLDSDDETNYKFNHFAIQEGYLQLIPNPNTERQILYIAGASGSGKSYFTGQYLKEYKNTFPDNPIYMFSTIPKGDVSLKDVEIDYIDLNTILEEELTSKDFENSMVIFGDCDTKMEPCKYVLNALQSIYNMFDLLLNKFQMNELLWRKCFRQEQYNHLKRSRL